MWIVWNPAAVTLQIIHKSTQLIHCYVRDKQNGDQWLLYVVYGLHIVEDRRNLWLQLSTFDKNIAEPWCIMGNINVVLAVEDRINGVPVSSYKTKDFMHLLNATNLSKYKSSGYFFSWSNKGTGDVRIVAELIDVLLIHIG